MRCYTNTRILLKALGLTACVLLILSKVLDTFSINFFAAHLEITGFCQGLVVSGTMLLGIMTVKNYYFAKNRHEIAAIDATKKPELFALVGFTSLLAFLAVNALAHTNVGTHPSAIMLISQSLIFNGIYAGQYANRRRPKYQ